MEIPAIGLPVIVPCSMMSSMDEATESIGIANPRPSMPVPEPLATTIPTSSPLLLNSAPPELPSLMDASVCISVRVLFSSSILRSFALMMPAVTVPPSFPSGLPITTARSPTDSLLLLPIVTAFSLVASILRTAISVCSS